MSLQDLASQGWIEHLGWTLIQFLWQGTVIALLFAGVRALASRSMTVHSRYILSCSVLGIMVAAPVVTFLVRPDAPPLTSWPLPSLDSWHAVLPWLVAAWFCGVLALSVRLVGGWRVTARLRSTGVRPVQREWCQRLEALISQIGVSRPVQLLTSSRVEVPTVVGWLKPVILVPVGALTGLPADHVEALLAHELAHIRRYDYLVNMLQSVAESVLFYHPAVWWISGQVRAERELCCDDIAVRASGDVLTYVHALAALESYRPAQSRHALAANGGSLLNRIRRLVGQTPPLSHALPSPGAAGAMSLLWLLGIGVMAANGSTAPFSVEQPALTPQASVSSTSESAQLATGPNPILSALLFGPYGPASQQLTGPSALSTGTIEGRVLRAGTGEPIANMPVTLIESPGISGEASATMLDQIAAQVTLGLQIASQANTNTAVTNLIRNAGPSVSDPRSILTDRTGHFEFTNLRKGRYTVWSLRQGYFGPSFNGVPAAASARTIVFDPAQPVPVDLVVTPSVVISGRVLDPKGRPVSGANVTAYRPTYNDGRLIWAPALSRTTDDLGEYRIVWLAPGDYYVGVTPPQTATAVSGAKETWIRTFFPGVIEPAQGRKLSVNSGEIRGIDITFLTASNAFFRISGVALNPQPGPNSVPGDRSFNAFVLMPREFSPVDGTDSMTFPNMLPPGSRQNGEFEIRNVRPGTYDLFPVFAVYGFPAGRTFVDVRNSDAVGVRVAVNPAVNLEGTVVVHEQGAQAVPLESMKIGLRSRSIPSIRTQSSIPVFPVDASGKFTAVGLAGEEALVDVTGLPEAAYVADILQGDQSVYDSGLRLTASPEPLRVIVGSMGGTVEGIVRNEQRQPESLVTVVLVPAAERRQNAALFKTRVTNDAGRFEIRGIPPGTYTVLAWKSVPPTAWQNAEFLSSFVNRGHVVKVTSSSRSSLELESIP
jgi:beta-lactamase regulating signal transducer with metallopeptidase domain